MRIIAFIEDGEVIEKILKHLGLWEAGLTLKVKATSETIYLSESDQKITTCGKG